VIKVWERGSGVPKVNHPKKIAKVSLSTPWEEKVKIKTVNTPVENPQVL